jgi:preprotein translocase subunit YajC
VAEKEKQLKVGDRVTLLGRKGTVVRVSKSVVTVKWDKKNKGVSCGQ